MRKLETALILLILGTGVAHFFLSSPQMGLTILMFAALAIYLRTIEEEES